MPLDPLTRDAMSIWQAGVAAVDSRNLVRRNVAVRGDAIEIAGERLPLVPSSRLIVVGAGKAGAGMAAGFESALEGTPLFSRVAGWVNVPADCVRELRSIHLHGARPAGVNEPREEGVAGTEEILRLVGSATAQDIVVVLLSGGGSALLPAPVPGISLADKQRVTRFLSGAGATIQELNAVRTHLSRVKGGRLAEATQAGRLVTLVISDVIGDPLDVIASGPTWPGRSTRENALTILGRFDPERRHVPMSVYRVLEDPAAGRDSSRNTPARHASHHILGSNRVACDAAADAAQRMGYLVREVSWGRAGDATAEGERLARRLLELRRESASTGKPLCVIDGGEPTVRLPVDVPPGRGGRNQQLALSALVTAWDAALDNAVLLSAGTDGEDGPTDAAGGYISAEVLQAARRWGESPAQSLRRCDAYPYLDRIGGLWTTGPTQTNVMDLRVLVARG
jgi:glycerate 2-kinase